MSADVNVILRRDALIGYAHLLSDDACAEFRVEAGESRHICQGCHRTLAAHVIRALNDAREARDAE